jgi:hypothetical protein
MLLAALAALSTVFAHPAAAQNFDAIQIRTERLLIGFAYRDAVRR